MFGLSVRRFTLLDGPPYANGPAHVGHALNKLLKDFIVRHRMATGHRVRMRPGWDCHGLPIEIAVEKQQLLAANDKDQVDDRSSTAVLQLRAQCRALANAAVDTQMRSVRAWAVLADWPHPYLTMHNEYCARQIELVGRMMADGMVYTARRPVFWSPAARTALAEAELEYVDAHTSTAAIARFAIVNYSHDADRKVYALAWTTTPWTLPLNNALCYAADNVDYVFVTITGNTRCARISKSYPCHSQLQTCSRRCSLFDIGGRCASP
jgi:isoleucyl-tRNA synthetase